MLKLQWFPLLTSSSVYLQDEGELLEALAAVLRICDVTFVSSEEDELRQRQEQQGRGLAQLSLGTRLGRGRVCL